MKRIDRITYGLRLSNEPENDICGWPWTYLTRQTATILADDSDKLEASVDCHAWDKKGNSFRKEIHLVSVRLCLCLTLNMSMPEVRSRTSCKVPQAQVNYCIKVA